MGLPRRRVLFFAVVLALIVSDPAWAQLEAGDFAARIDSIRASTDTASLRRLVEGDADDNGAPADEIARGFAAFRLFAITGDETRAERARSTFERAREQAPEDPWAWYGLGLTWALGPEATRDDPGVVLFQAFARALRRDPASRALRAFRRSLELDPNLVGAATDLVPVAIQLHDDDALRLAQSTLARAHLQGRFGLEALTALAHAERALGNSRAAVEAARRAAVMSGDDPSFTYGLALALFAAGEDREGAQKWRDAVTGLTPDLTARIYDDVRPIASEWENERWNRLDEDGRREWLEDFWTTRAALAGVSIDKRIGEHYRRLTIARQRYYNRRRWGAPPYNALLLERPDLPFDDRGLIYVRHGEPFDVIRSAPFSGVDNESWVYRSLDGGFRVLHFFKYGSPGGSVGPIGDAGAAAANGEMGGGYNDFVLVHILPCGGWSDDRVHYDRRLHLMRCNEYDQRAISGEIRREALAALRSDSDSPEFVRDLDFVSDVFTFRGEGDRTDVVAGVLLPADAVQPAPAYLGVAWDLDVSLIVADTFFNRVARVDSTLRLLRSEPPAPGSLLRLTLGVPVVPGSAQAQRIVVASNDDPTHGRMVGRTLDVPDYSGRQLLISDIVLAEPDSGGSFRRGDVALSLVPTREFPGGAFQAYYEIYNLTPDGTYTTEVTVEKAGGGVGGLVRGLFGGGPEVQLRFDDVASPLDVLSRELRRVDTSLGAGDYRIRVRVTDHASGRSTEREREFTVVR
jgi:tetratricopeptide (TPR) repeat protein